MIDAAKKHKNATVIGGGLLGLEAANGLMKQGMNTTVVHRSEDLMDMQLDSAASQMLLLSLKQKGMQFKLKAQTQRVIAGNSGRVEKIEFSDGSTIDTDLVVMAVGIRPNIELAQKSGIHCEKGIVVNDAMQAFESSIYAVGECVQHRDRCYGLVAPLFEQARVCASHIAECNTELYEGSITSTKLKVTGVDLFSAGNFTGTDSSEDLIFQDQSRGVYKKIVIENRNIIGSVLYGDTVDSAWYLQLMKDKVDIAEIRDSLIFGQAYASHCGDGPIDMVAAMADSSEVCGCNGVSKGKIVDAINAGGLSTLSEVRIQTKASSSCGSCSGLVEQVIASTLGSNYSNTANKESLCGCTEHSKQEVHDFAFQNGLDFATVFEVFAAMSWNNTDGCHICRPALNYYLLAANPNYKDDAQSRFINERAHGNIQKDGTYSVIPRMWGGVTTPGELRVIADVADKYKVSTVKVTGGQRIDLLGIVKEDLPKVWHDLNSGGLVSGHAYGKALRTVKTCVGSDWCRFGTQDSTAMGIKLERMTWGSWMPHKFKMGVSGCPRNCAEATIKDFGVICTEKGYEIHVAGACGIRTKACLKDRFFETEADVVEYLKAFVQLYRVEANYLERVMHFEERVGLEYIQSKLDTPEKIKKWADQLPKTIKNPWVTVDHRSEWSA
jgi:nitrite reductase (NADH) large subunit